MPLSKNLIGHHYLQCIWHYWACRISLNSKHQLKESVFMRVWLWACENPGVLVSYAARATSNHNILEVCRKAFTLHVAAGSLEVGRPRLGLAAWFYFLLQLWLGLTSCLGFSSGLPPVKEQQIFGRSSFHGDDKGIRGVKKTIRLTEIFVETSGNVDKRVHVYSFCILQQDSSVCPFLRGHLLFFQQHRLPKHLCLCTCHHLTGLSFFFSWFCWTSHLPKASLDLLAELIFSPSPEY